METLHNKTIIIHKHDIPYGGIGDFIRSALSFFTLSQKMGYEFYIDLSDNIKLKNCFITPSIPMTVSYENFEIIKLGGGIYKYEDIEQTLYKIKNNPKTYIIYSNAIGYEKNISDYTSYFFSNILKPSLAVNNLLDDIYKKYDLTPNNYVSVHIRCGDRHMGRNLDGKINLQCCDFRIDIDNNNSYEHFNNIINNFKNNYDIKIPIIIHSDSVLFKQKFIDFQNLDIEIQHLNGFSVGSNNNDSAYISTTAEFYFIANAEKIIMPDVYTGFSHSASLVNATKLYVNFDSIYFNFYNANNIVKF